ncbi:MAG: T9SS type A sorting domain-containing protein [Maribacter sp.]|nr:T9SS type A sorting domain-containing protein [Maribacter sp.]
MKKIYFVLLVAFSFVLSAQEPIVDFTDSPSNEISGFKLYPNPVFDDVVYIKTDKNARKEIAVYDVFGKVVLTDRILNTALNISTLVPGVYVLQVTESNSTITRKLVVK